MRGCASAQLLHFRILHIAPGSGSGGGIAILDQGAGVQLFVTNVTTNKNQAGKAHCKMSLKNVVLCLNN